MDRITRTIPPARQISVEAPARLHMGFMDLNGQMGRRFGSIGLCLDGLATRLRAEPCARLEVTGACADRIGQFIRQVAARYGLPATGRFQVDAAIPAHVGLGSGTQLALATGIAVLQLHGVAPDLRELARLLDRGGRSGIGIGAFETGGFLVDGGRREEDEPPRIIARLAFPEDWRVLLLFDRAGQGVHGSQEVEAFRRLPPFPGDAAAHLCRLVLMRLLPALADRDCETFGHAVTALQETVGDHFAPAQGGRYASPVVAAALALLQEAGVAGVGQSSWGPTGFAIVPSADEARRCAALLDAHFGADGRLQVMTTTGRNQGGATVSVPDPSLLKDC